MFRMMLQQVFECGSYSKYYSAEKFQRGDESISLAIGALPLPRPWKEAYASMSADREGVCVVKTHDPPQDDQRAIFIARNGLAAVRSYKHYLFDVKQIEYSLEQVILGEAGFGSWGGCLDAWNPLERPNTLLLKYEDLVERPDRELQRAGQFLGLVKKGEWINKFEELHSRNPKMYRQGPGVPAEYGFTPQQRELFTALHGDWMTRLHYKAPTLSNARELRAALIERLNASRGAAWRKKRFPILRALGWDLYTERT